MFRDRFGYPARFSALVISTVLHIGMFGYSVFKNGELSTGATILFFVFTLLLAVAWVRLLEEKFVWSGGKAGQDFYADAANSIWHGAPTDGPRATGMPRTLEMGYGDDMATNRVEHAIMDDDEWEKAREEEKLFLFGQQANAERVIKEFGEYVPSPDPADFDGPGAPGTIERTAGGTVRQW